MIRRLTATGLPGCRDLDILADPAGITWISGRPGTGKSTAARTLAALLTGSAPAGAASCEIQRQRTAADGTVQGFVTTLQSVAGKRASTADVPALRDAELIEAIVSPDVALDMPHRPLRDLLTRAAGVAGSVRPIVAALVTEAGHTLDDADVIEEKAVTNALRDARRALDFADGALRQAQAATGSTEPAPPTGDLEAASAIVEAARAWAAYDAAAAGSTEPEPHRPDVGPLATDLRAREQVADAAGSRIETAREALRVARETQGRLRAEYASTRAALDRSRAAADRIQRVPCRGSTVALDGAAVDCSTCPALASDRGDAEALGLHEVRLAELTEQGRAAGEAVTRAEAAGSEASAAAQRATTALAESRRAYDYARAAERAHAAWASRQRARPATPSDPRPSPEEVAAARATVTAHHEYAGRVAQHQQATAAAADALAKATAAHDEAAARASRWAAIQQAVRKAPSVIVDQIKAALGDLGPLTLSFGEGTHATTDPAVTVLYGARPLSTASTGERIHADALFRAAIRRAAARHTKPLARLPIVVDHAESAGDLLTDAVLHALSPAWILTTTDGDLEVTRD